MYNIEAGCEVLAKHMSLNFRIISGADHIGVLSESPIDGSRFILELWVDGNGLWRLRAI